MSRSDKFQLQSDVSPTLKQRKMYTIAYVKIDYFDEQAIKNELLQLQGGQLHVQCNEHKRPLI